RGIGQEETTVLEDAGRPDLDGVRVLEAEAAHGSDRQAAHARHGPIVVDGGMLQGCCSGSIISSSRSLTRTTRWTSCATAWGRRREAAAGTRASGRTTGSSGSATATSS